VSIGQAKPSKILTEPQGRLHCEDGSCIHCESPVSFFCLASNETLGRSRYPDEEGDDSECFGKAFAEYQINSFLPEAG
jgi:hypothetical protein